MPKARRRRKASEPYLVFLSHAIPVRQHIEVEPIPSMLKSKKVIELNQIDEYLKELSLRVKAHR
jgi:hypothetical protein